MVKLESHQACQLAQQAGMTNVLDDLGQQNRLPRSPVIDGVDAALQAVTACVNNPDAWFHLSYQAFSLGLHRVEKDLDRVVNFLNETQALYESRADELDGSAATEKSAHEDADLMSPFVHACRI